MVEGRLVFEGVFILECRGELPGKIDGLACDSRLLNPGELFVALRGATFDGHDFISVAEERGACAAVVEDWCEATLPQVQVENTLVSLPRIAANVYEHPANRLHLTGITGSNGKTTSTYLLESIYQAASEPVAIIGTIEMRYGGRSYPSETTTPLAHELQRHLKRIADAGIGHAIMEVSSHGLALHRVDEVEFDTAIFTNLTQDHLDFHHNMHEYREAKKRLFTRHLKGNGVAVLNVDDETGQRFAQELLGHGIITYGIDTPADVMAQELCFALDRTGFLLVLGAEEIPIETLLIGRHNIYNILGVAAAAWSQGMKPETIRQGIESAKPVPGRLESVPNPLNSQIVVDYCHTPDALENCLRTLQALPHKQLITVVGCGGDRDRAKRPLMGNIAERLSDWVIVTSDNPRTEDPQRIIDEILQGMSGRERIETIPDRRQAIERGIEMLESGGILLLAGKGHEDYQIVGRDKHPFDDRKVAAEMLHRILERRSAMAK